MLVVPPALLNVLQPTAGAKAELTIDNGRLVVVPAVHPCSTMAELLASSGFSQPKPAYEPKLVSAPAVGGELI
tara:strand:- start:7553 stop:7771 length:219 start_codon:yes stop_codon:yes gene_type:complete